MDVYADYKNWKHENFEMINTLIKIKSNIISRFSHVILVVDYLYDKRQKDGQDLDPDLEVIFETGFNYIHDHFLTITSILEQEYRNDIVQMDKNSKTINLLLYIHDFENELLNDEEYEQMLADLADTLMNEELLAEMAEKEKVGSIYDCNGPYKFVENWEEDEDEDDSWEDEDEDENY